LTSLGIIKEDQDHQWKREKEAEVDLEEGGVMLIV
jgi:hypothetical protein